MKEPTMDEVLKLVAFDRDTTGQLFVRTVKGSVWGSVLDSVGGNIGGNVKGNVKGTVYGDVKSTVKGTIGGREWQFVETPKEEAIRLIREGKGEEAIKVLEESDQ